MNQRSIPFFNYPALFASQKKELMEVIEDVCSRGAYILQRDLREFELHLAEFLNIQYAIGVANGTDALIIALRAAGIKPGDEVILPSHTYIATAASVHFVEAIPVLADCGKDHMIDPKSVKALVSGRTRAIMPVQLNGRTCDMDALQAISGRHGLIIVEDAAQGLGSKFKGRHAGTFGIAGTFSLYPAKVLGCFGDGGAVVTDDSQVAEKISLLRDHGRNPDGEVVTWGLNSRLDNLQAAILDYKLKTFPQAIQRRREIARLYVESLSEIEDIVLPPGPDNDSDRFDVYQNYEIEAGERDRLRSHLEKAGVRTIIQWGGKAVHQFKGLGFESHHLPFTERMFKRCFMLPMNTALTDDDVHYICEAIRTFYGLKT